MLVHAAAGGVGIAALQILRDRGAEVIGTASAAKHDAVRAQGAAHVIDYRTQDVPAEVKRITQGQGVDVVLDALGSFRESYRILRPGGRLVMYGASQLLTGDKRNILKTLRAVAAMPRFNSIKLMNDNKSVMGMNLLHWWDDRGSLEEVTGPLARAGRARRDQAGGGRDVPVRARGGRAPLHPGAQERRQGRPDALRRLSASGRGRRPG